LGICFFPTFGVLCEKSYRIMNFIIFALPRIIEGLWDFFNKLGFPLKFDDCINVIFSLSMASILLLWNKYKKDFPNSYERYLKMVYKD